MGGLLGLCLVFCSVVLTSCGGGGGGAVAAILGIVADGSTLQPLAGAVVQVGARTSDPTDVAGNFALNNVATGNQTLTAILAGYETAAVQTFLVAGGNNVGTIYMPQGAVGGMGHVTGTVRDGGATVAGATVIAGGKTAYTRADGTYAIYNLPPGNVTVHGQFGAKTGLAVALISDGGTATADISLNVSPPPPPAI